MDMKLFQSLSTREQALICVAVLLDGFEASSYLANDLKNGVIFEKLSSDFANLSPELRTPLLGTLLRQSLKDAKSRK